MKGWSVSAPLEAAPESLDLLVQRARALTARLGRRALLGICGPPGSGKSTLASLLCEALSASAVVVPQDGYHLGNAQLERLGRLDRKGAADTFDSDGFAALLQRVRDCCDRDVYFPVFHRDAEESVAAEGAVPPTATLVIVEGLWLLRDDWAVRALLDECWFVACDEQERHDRLIRRRLGFGYTVEQARAWTLGSDEANARQVAATQAHAQSIVRFQLPASPLRRPTTTPPDLLNLPLRHGVPRLVVYGSSVARGSGAAWDYGWARMLRDALHPRGWDVLNLSESGSDTERAMDRFPEVIAAQPACVLISLSLANEGFGPNFVKNIGRLVQCVKAIGATCVVASVYPNNECRTMPVLHAKLLDARAELLALAHVDGHIDWLSSLSDGHGGWCQGESVDAGHPNSRGHQHMFECVDLTLFDRLRPPEE